MFAINHAATAMVLKKRYPAAPWIGLLAGVQLIELLWVGLNVLEIEITETERVVRWVGDIHLVHMPWSHSLATTAVLGTVAWAGFRYFSSRPEWGIPIALGMVSHLVLDLATHTPDIALAPWAGYKLGMGIYAVPLLGLIVETAYGWWCAWYAQAGPWLTFGILAFNLSNLSFFTPVVVGPEGWLADKPVVLAILIFVQILATLAMVGLMYRARVEDSFPQPTPVHGRK